MLKKKIKYTDYNGVEREEEFFFNLTKAEIMEMQLSTNGGMEEMVKSLVSSGNMAEITRIFKDIILKSYGEKSIDGRRFIKVDEKGNPLSIAFSQTEAYSNLFMELATNSKSASAFVNAVIPGDLEVSEEQQKKIMEELFGPQNDNIEPISESNEETISESNEEQTSESNEKPIPQIEAPVELVSENNTQS